METLNLGFFANSLCNRSLLRGIRPLWMPPSPSLVELLVEYTEDCFLEGLHIRVPRYAVYGAIFVHDMPKKDPSVLPLSKSSLGGFARVSGSDLSANLVPNSFAKLSSLQKVLKRSCCTL